MSDSSISVEAVSKLYRLGVAEQRQESLLGEFFARASAPVRNIRKLWRLDTRRAGENNESEAPDLLWALKDVSFEVKRGEVLGIIGRNGAGKSTLLKILSRITVPTQGRVRIQGQVASLLEVGTGFHPDLTGRENVYLNGTILGMSRREINRRFDEIVEFSGVERFLDTPVKRYSSGMRVRLGFAVAAHLEPEVLIVDEVLAVGDADFQRKCLGKMRSVVGSGERTVLFVSHNMASVEALCDRVAIMESGRLKQIGATSDIIQDYMNSLPGRDNRIPISSRTDREGNGRAVCTDLWIADSNGNRTDQIRSGQDVQVCLQFRVIDPAIQPMQFGIGIYDSQRVCLTQLNTKIMPVAIERSTSEGIGICELPKLPLPPGEYWLNVSITGADGKRCDRVEQAVYFDVHEGDYFGTGRMPVKVSGYKVLMQHSWKIEEIRSSPDAGVASTVEEIV